ncbi:MAG: histidinol dehydrogenase, partial [Candidatus Nitrosocosmicus sp.]
MINIFNVKEPINDANELREKTWNKDIEVPTNNVRVIINEIKKGKDDALLKYIEKFDNVKLDSFVITKEEIKEAYEKVTPNQIKTIEFMKMKLEKSEQAIVNSLKNIKIDSEDIKINKKVIPISRVG